MDNTANRNHFCSEENRSAAISDGERPPAGPFLNDQKGAKESVKEGDFDFPLLDNPPLKTTKHRENRDPNGAQRSGSIWERRGKGAERDLAVRPG